MIQCCRKVFTSSHPSTRKAQILQWHKYSDPLLGAQVKHLWQQKLTPSLFYYDAESFALLDCEKNLTFFLEDPLGLCRVCG